MKRTTSTKGRAGEADAGAAAPGAGASDTDPSFDSMLRKIAHVSHMRADPPLPRLGQVIGEKYRIEACLGRGGMGVVYRATHLVSRKAVALKWMLRSTADGSAHRRLLREALAAGRIDHPNVVDVYDVGQEGVCAYLVMELLHGEALRARLDRGRLESTEAIDLLLPALRGVSAAHRAGVIHRDLKPDNIFLCTDPGGSAREAKVLDFGVSAVIVQSTLHPTLTDGATILGTPAYMSPEQLVSSRDTDERTDVYAFGVILYEALTGQLPFVAGSYSGLVLAVARDLPKAPSEVCSDIPGKLEQVILQALSKERQDRPQTIDALHDLLVPFGSAHRRADFGGGAAHARRASSERCREDAGDPRPAGLLVPGEVFASRYRVWRCIAEGGRGATFEAEHITTERRVALKLFPRMMSAGEARNKFELEAKVSARVNSPYIVEVLDAGYDEETQSQFLVMELLKGQTVEEWVRREGPLEVDPALRLLEQVASGLDAAHAYRGPGGAVQPIVHRDLKPENLFLARQHDRSIVAKILGYGTAKVLGETGTETRELRGTPLYMSFEQITGGALSAQSDVWALGLIGFYMLTGARYWSAGYGERSSVQTLFAEILSAQREAPSMRLREQSSSVELPPEFDAWMLRCIHRDPFQRFASAGDAVRALGQVFEPARRAASKPSPVPTREGVGTVYEADAAPESSIPASVSTEPRPTARRRTERRPPALARALLAAPTHWLVVGAAAGGMLLGVVGWLATRDGEAAGASPAETAAAETSADVTADREARAPAAPARAREFAGDQQAALPAPPDNPLPAAGPGRQGRPLFESTAALRAVPPSEGALADWAPAEPAAVEHDRAEASLLPQKLPARRERSAKEDPLAGGASKARSRPRKERTRREADSEWSASGPDPETTPQPGLAEAYETR
jgi:eukaryotic-like serine/threonine-protein kinase